MVGSSRRNKWMNDDERSPDASMNARWAAAFESVREAGPDRDRSILAD
jgi:hypothetical protein